MPDRAMTSRPMMRPKLRQNSFFLPTLSPEVGFLDTLVHHETGCVVLQNDPPRLHDIASVRNRQCHVGILLHEKDRRSMGVDLSDDFKYGLNEFRSQAK